MGSSCESEGTGQVGQVKRVNNDAVPLLPLENTELPAYP